MGKFNFLYTFLKNSMINVYITFIIERETSQHWKSPIIDLHYEEKIKLK